MWMVCALLSLILMGLSWIYAVIKDKKVIWTSSLSMLCMTLTFLLQYHLTFKWVLDNDMSALMDVVPTMFITLTGYFILMAIAEVLVIAIYNRKG